jgi:hypothetical protein
MTPTNYDLRTWGRLIKTIFKNFPNIYTHLGTNLHYIPIVISKSAHPNGQRLYHRYNNSLDKRWRHPYIHGLCTGMVCTWWPLVEKFSILLWQARVGREIERYVREREEEMRSSRGGWQELLVWFYTTGSWGRRCKQTEVPPGVNISWYRYVESRGDISMWATHPPSWEYLQ